MVSTSPPSHAVLDRRGLLAEIARTGHGVLELGCGPTKRHPEAVSIDALDFEAVDVVGDVFAALALVPDGSIEAVHSYHFLEHVEALEHLVSEVSRVLCPGGLLHAVVPHFSNPYFYSDYTHRRAFGLYSFSYLAEDRILRRRVPRYQVETGLELRDVRLRFKAAPPFYVRHALRQLLDAWVNLSRWTQEWYEAGWTGWFPCYEVEYRLHRR